MSKIPPNPNLTKNRIPRERELQSIRELALQKQEAIDDLVEKAARARTKHEAIKSEYNSQLTILEEIESNLHLTKQNAESFEKAAATLGGEMLHLRGLLHPIRRSTDDVLRIIFESVVAGSAEPFLTATRLSHVCQRWRNIAISSPRLWSDFILEASRAYCTPRSKAQAFLSRVGNAATTLAIHVDASYLAIQDVIRPIHRWPLFEISSMRNISIWEISVYSTSAENCSPILGSINRWSSSTLECLKLNINAPISQPINEYISNLNFRKLELTLPHFGPTNPPCLIPSFDNLVEVLLLEIAELSILGILGTMPKLQTLGIWGCSVNAEPILHGADVLLRHLTVFDFFPGTMPGYFPWRQIKCPKLTKMGFCGEGPDLQDAIYAFVSVTTSITDVTIDGASSEDLLNLARIAPQLRRLSTSGTAESTVLGEPNPEPQFPNLLHLELDWCSCMSPEDLPRILDGIIQKRCLSRAHSMGAVDPTVPYVLEAFSVTMPAFLSKSCVGLLARHFSAHSEGDQIIHRFVGEQAGRMHG